MINKEVPTLREMVHQLYNFYLDFKAKELDESIEAITLSSIPTISYYEANENIPDLPKIAHLKPKESIFHNDRTKPSEG